MRTGEQWFGLSDGINFWEFFRNSSEPGNKVISYFLVKK